MRKIVSLLLVVVLVMGFVGMVSASEWDMWKGDFIRSNPSSLLTSGQAGGEVKMNYIKGQKAYMVNISAFGLDPNVSYEAWFMTTSGFSHPSYNHVLIGDLTVDEYGIGRYFNNRVAPQDLYLDKTKIRVVIYELPRSSGSWVLSTSLAVSDGDLQPVGSERGE